MALPPNPADNTAWREALATVTACTYTAGAGRAMAFGLPTSRHFRIAFNYEVAGTLYTGEFSSRTAMPQGTLFPITYNPARPAQNDRSHSQLTPGDPPGRTAVLLFGLAGSAVLSLGWLAVLRGCR